MMKRSIMPVPVERNFMIDNVIDGIDARVR